MGNLIRLVGAVLAISVLLVAPATVQADPGDVGFAGPSGSGAGAAPSGSKPQAKVWFNDGIWWADLWDQATGDFYIWRLNRVSQTWSRTATRLDDRPSTRADILWDGSKLYVASHQFSESDGSGSSRLYRYSYAAGSDSYTLDAGFPVVINTVKSETLVLAKDSTGQLWVTWEQGKKIWVNRTVGSDTAWGAPFQVPGSAAVASDDITSVIAFGGNKIGVFWSNQSTEQDYFAIHSDSAADTTWLTPEVAYTGADVADDHINLKTDSAGKLYAVVKTSKTGSSALITLLDRSTAGVWSAHTVSTGSTGHTRPILLIDESNAKLRVYLTSSGSGGTINEKTSSISSISFPPGSGTVVIKDASDNDLNNATSTKQNINGQTGLIVMAFNDSTNRYWHTDVFASGPPPPPPTPTPPPSGGQTFNAVEDAQVKSNSASTNYGSLATLQLRQDPGTGTTYHDYLKFTVTGLSGPVTSVRLRLFVNDASSDSGTVYSTSSGWSEGSITWSNAPAFGTTALGSAGASTAGAWIEITLPASAVTGNGTFSFALRTGSSNSTIFSSSEGANAPRLVVGT